jgi:TRAP-type C4-dicarboxylate transport system permease small subunit
MRDWSPVMGLPLWVWLFVLPSALAALCLILGPRLERPLRPLWKLMNGIYLTSGLISALFMITILVLIVAQMVARWTGFALPGTTEFAGYAMAATSFFALSYALTKGAHIRVSILLNANNFTRKWLDIFAVFSAAIIATYFARYAVKANTFSEMLNDRTQGQDQIPEWVVSLFRLDFEAAMQGGDTLVYTPVWIPQLAMSIGTILLAIALWDTLYRLLILGRNPIVAEAIE